MKKQYIILLLVTLLLIAGVSADGTISLSRIEVTSSEWHANTTNIVYVNCYGINNQSVDVDGMSINIKGNIGYSNSSVVRYDVGKYQQSFSFNNTDLTQVNLTIRVTEQTKTITKYLSIDLKTQEVNSTIVSMTEFDQGEKVNNGLFYYFINIKRFANDNIWLLIIIALAVIVFIVFGIIGLVFLRMKKG